MVQERHHKTPTSKQGCHRERKAGVNEKQLTEVVPTTNEIFCSTPKKSRQLDLKIAVGAVMYTGTTNVKL